MRVLAFLLSFAAGAPLCAAPITYTFDGTVNDIYGIDAGDIESTSLGDAWTATYMVDAEAVGNIFDQYELPAASFEVGTSGTIGIPAHAPNFSNRLTLGQNEYNKSDNNFDSLFFFAASSDSSVMFDDFFVSQLRVELIDNDSDLFPGSETPNLPAQMRAANFESLLFRIALDSDKSNGQREAYIVGDITAITVNGVTTVVPIPAAVWLFGSALIGLSWMRSAR